MTPYFNEFDPFASKWLRKLFPAAEVDARSIEYVEPEDLVQRRQCHFFAGIGGWELALKLAGWPEDQEVWTGSCPCQPFSVAGAGEGEADERHLWPEFFRLIAERRPAVVFGEQVANAVGHGWLDGVFADLEGQNYACGAVVLGAHSAGAPHIRQRLFWVADSRGAECRRRGESIWQQRGALHVTDRCGPSGLGNSNMPGRIQYSGAESVRAKYASPECAGSPIRLGNTEHSRCEGRESHGGWPGAVMPSGYWSDFDIIECSDGKSRRIPPIESGVFPLADGVPNRVGRLRGYGNAIVPQVAAMFIRAFTETLPVVH